MAVQYMAASPQGYIPVGYSGGYQPGGPQMVGYTLAVQQPGMPPPPVRASASRTPPLTPRLAPQAVRGAMSVFPIRRNFKRHRHSEKSPFRMFFGLEF